MAQNKVDNIQVNAPKDIDNKKGVVDVGGWRCYNNIDEAKLAIPIEIRYPTLIVNILKSGIPTEYWWRDGNLDNDLIEKIPDIPDATTTIKGKLKLTNHLGGTADVPTVVAVETKPTSDSSNAPASTAWVKGLIAESGGGGGSYELPIATNSVLGGIRIGNGLTTASGGVTSLQVKTINSQSIIGTGNIDISGSGSGGGGSQTLQQTLTLGRTGDKMKITESMEIPVSAPETINAGSIWIGSGTSGGGGGGGGGITLTTIGSSGASTLISGVLNIPVYSGGGGGGSISSLSDVTLTSIANNQILQWNSGTSKWVNANPPTGTSYTLPIATPSVLGGIRIGSGLGYDPATGITSVIPTNTTLQQALTAGRIGDSMKITTSMEIPTVAPSTINAGNVWVGAGSSATGVLKSKANVIVNDTLTTYLIDIDKSSNYIILTNASAITASIGVGKPLSSVFVRQGGAGKVTFISKTTDVGGGPVDDVTIIVKTGKTAKTETQNAVVELFYETATRIIITGDLDNI